jgi:flagellar hook-length control protein FliK
MQSQRTKARTTLQSAMSMLNYHLNRGGRQA